MAHQTDRWLLHSTVAQPNTNWRSKVSTNPTRLAVPFPVASCRNTDSSRRPETVRARIAADQKMEGSQNPHDVQFAPNSGGNLLHGRRFTTAGILVDLKIQPEQHRCVYMIAVSVVCHFDVRPGIDEDLVGQGSAPLRSVCIREREMIGPFATWPMVRGSANGTRPSRRDAPTLAPNEIRRRPNKRMLPAEIGNVMRRARDRQVSSARHRTHRLLFGR